MTLHVFLVETDDAVRAVTEGALTLTGREGHHAADVRRLRAGEAVEVTDGHGQRLACTVRRVSRAHVELVVDRASRESRETPVVTVAQALVKQDSAERALAAMTEVGVDAVLPFTAERSVVTWDDSRVERGLRRWRAAVEQAAKQARRAWVPDVAPPVDLDALSQRLRRADLALVLDAAGATPLADVDANGATDVVLVVGPEGGLSRREIDAMVSAGAMPARLGPTVLRSATAGPVAASVLLSRTQRWLTRHEQTTAG